MAKLAFKHASFEGRHIGDNELRAIEECDLVLAEIGHTEPIYEAARRIKTQILGEAGWFHLNLGNLDLGDKGAVQVARILTHSPHMVKKVMMEGNKIGPEGAKAMARMLVHNKDMIVLVMQSNEVMDEGAAAIAESLHVNASLEILGLHTNFLTDKAGIALGDMLAHNRKLRVLSINHNAIGDEGAKALGEGLKHNANLEGLSFSFNCVTDAGAVALAEALPHNKKLRHLWVNGNPVGQEGLEALDCHVRCNRTIQQIRLTLHGYDQYREMVDESAGTGFQALGTGPHRTSVEYRKDVPYAPKLPEMAVSNDSVRPSVEAASGLFTPSRGLSGEGQREGQAEAVRALFKTDSAISQAWSAVPGNTHSHSTAHPNPNPYYDASTAASATLTSGATRTSGGAGASTGASMSAAGAGVGAGAGAGAGAGVGVAAMGSSGGGGSGVGGVAKGAVGGKVEVVGEVDEGRDEDGFADARSDVGLGELEGDEEGEEREGTESERYTPMVPNDSRIWQAHTGAWGAGAQRAIHTATRASDVGATPTPLHPAPHPRFSPRGPLGGFRESLDARARSKGVSLDVGGQRDRRITVDFGGPPPRAIK